ncbi:hypothetical protein CWI80_01860 [Pseudidiomarina sediminum]|uniref:Uncharacterized protein n=1 Tax=Pseudidiomarina sediminum TaxID=431675 RepID=A0A432Z8F8_9GAMM|nr:hypothetical protein [Pseudidiomarina sediminum]RUO74131.1 hypothetical protein CWI80_01860 [Pseudidiomarina sediminum]
MTDFYNVEIDSGSASEEELKQVLSILKERFEENMGEPVIKTKNINVGRTFRSITLSIRKHAGMSKMILVDIVTDLMRSMQLVPFSVSVT